MGLTRKHWAALAVGLACLGAGVGLRCMPAADDPPKPANSAEAGGGRQLAAADDPPGPAKSAEERAKIDVGPPPEDANELSMEVAALRTLYLMTVWPDNGVISGGPWEGFLDRAKEGKGTAEMPPPNRKPAEISAKYRDVLTNLRAAYIAGQDDRIIELTDQLDDLSTEEDPDLDDVVTPTPVACKMARRAQGYLNPERTVHYLNAYGKDFPSPQAMVIGATRGNGKGPKATPETRAFVIKEVSWQIGGLLPADQKVVADKLGKLFDKAEKLTDAECKKQWLLGGPLRKDFGDIKHGVGPMEILKHVMEQDIAELLSNPRLIPAIEARVAFLKRAGYNMERKKYEDED